MRNILLIEAVSKEKLTTNLPDCVIQAGTAKNQQRINKGLQRQHTHI
jgi:hypothetical protein